MSKYASKTQVPIDRSRSEIEKTLQRYGATGFMYGWDGSWQVIGFRIANRMVRMELPMPDPDDPQFRKTPAGQRRSDKAAIKQAYDQECGRRWRALALIVKAKLEAVESGISTVEREFMSDIVLPDGRTFGQWVAPQLEAVYEHGDMPPMLPGSVE